MAIVEQGKCKITAFNAQGLGVGYGDQGIVELPYTLPGETVAFERHRYRKHSNCILKEITKKSPIRATPPCPYFEACGGCMLQHLNAETYHNFKINLLHQALSSKQLYPTINDLIIVPSAHRRRGSFEVLKKNDQIFLGFRRLESHQIINIDACLVLTPMLSKLIKPLKKIFFQILEHNQKVNIFLLDAANGIDMVVELRGELTSLTLQQKTLLIAFAKDHSIIRLSTKINSKIDPIFQEEKPYVFFDGCQIAVDAGCFLQASALSDQILAQLILEFLDLKVSDFEQRGLDLFCGRGTFTLPLSRYAKMEGYESDESSLEALNTAAQQYNKSIITHPHDLFQNPLSTRDLNQYAFCVLNPPRAGAESQVRQLANSSIPQICYVSCNPETFARDASILEHGGYKLAAVTPMDQFYWTPHLEVVGYFNK